MAGVVWRCSTFATTARSISSGNPNLAVNGSRALLTGPAQISDSVSLKGPITGLFLEDFEVGGLWAGVVWRCSTFATAARSISSGNPNLALNGSRAVHPPEAVRSKLYLKLVFCYQNCSDLL